MKTQPRIIAFLGKGGTGKTALSALACRLLMKKPGLRLLLIDADPASGLTLALGVNKVKTIAEARQELIRSARAAKSQSDKKQLAAMIDYLILECLSEQPGFSVLAMGRSKGSGCYCSVNSLLRESIETLAQNFDYIVIDAEAGIEQVSREVTGRVNHPVIVTDSTMRGVNTAQGIADALKNTSQKKPEGVIFNRASKPNPSLKARLKKAGLKTLGAVPLDKNIARFDLAGKSLLDMPENSPALKALHQILSKAGIFKTL